MDENQQKSWYAVITADVLYDKSLTARQKLLMAVISNMANEKGYCFASNKYLSELMGVSISSVQRDLSVLEENYLNRVVKLKPNGEVEYRALTPVSHMNRGSVAHATTPHSTHDHIITNSSNNKYNISERIDFFVSDAKSKNSENKILSDFGIVEFVDYWTEHGENDKKARWEKEKSFDVLKRMKTWASRDYSGKSQYINSSDYNMDEIKASLISKGYGRQIQSKEAFLEFKESVKNNGMYSGVIKKLELIHEL